MNRGYQEDYFDFVALHAAPYRYGYRGTLTYLYQAASAGDHFIHITSAPEKLFHIGSEDIDSTFLGQVVFSDPKPKLLLYTDDGVKEWAEVDAFNAVPLFEGYTNIRLTKPLENDWDANDAVMIPMGCSWSLSQLHFDTGPGYRYSIVDDRSSNLQKPYRYRVVPYSDVKQESQAVLKIPEQTFDVIQSVTAHIDGYPHYLIGYSADVELDPEREQFFQEEMIIDDITYTVDKTDFYCDVTLGILESKARVSGNVSFIQAQQRKKMVWNAIDDRTERYKEGFTE
jgi:hypothetical protein